MKIYPLQGFKAKFDKFAADKSISHRFAIFSLLTSGENKADNFLLAEDTLNSLNIAQILGAKVVRNEDKVSILMQGAIQSPNCVLECGNSGTTMRLMMGFLAGIEGGFFVLSGDKYLNARPMRRIAAPLRKIGASIFGRDGANLAPLCVSGAKLEGFDYLSEIASAQVKTAMILAGFRAKTPSTYEEKELSRDHSENMLKAMNAPLELSKDKLKIKINPLQEPLKPLQIYIPNDPSSAFYFALAAIIVPNSSIVLENVLLNETRIEAFVILQKMGAKLEFEVKENSFEKIGTIYAQSSKLRAVEVSERISWLIDEAPALAIAFALARGTSVLRNAKELRVKESDRIAAVVRNLQKCGIEVQELEDGFKITGGTPKMAKIESFGDHRIAMSFAILALICGVEIDEVACINTSFPNFMKLLRELGASCEE